MPFKARAFGDYDRAKLSDATSLYCEDISRTVQAHERDANINNIVADFGVTGKLPENIRVPMYGDFTEITDYHSALEALRSAEQSFAAMPSSLREKLGNDPQRFLEYCADPNNLEEMRKLGLAVPAPDPTPGT